MSESEPLRRSLGTVLLTLYGVGVIVGAGIYVLVGEIVSTVGAAGWAAFVGAAVVALPTGLSYAELASRHPRSAGEAVFAQRAFGRPEVSFLVGFLIVASGVMSTAAVSHGFAEYLQSVVSVSWLPPEALAVAFLLVLSLVNARGIETSTWFNATCTVLSVLALLVLAIAGAATWPGHLGELASAVADVSPTAAVGAVALAFYAFIGFEDICNVAEETKNPSRTIPKAILLSLAISTVVYTVVTITALSVVSAPELATSDAPLALVAERVFPGVGADRWLGAVALLAVSNTALFNLIMTSRVLFGMGRAGWLPAGLGRVSTRTKAPIRGIAVAFVLAAAFAATGALRLLAEATNAVILLAFAAVNASLLTIRARKIEPDPDAGTVFRVPIAIPGVGLVLTLIAFTRLSPGAYLRAAILVGLGVVLHLVVRLRRGRGGVESAATATSEPGP